MPPYAHPRRNSESNRKTTADTERRSGLCGKKRDRQVSLGLHGECTTIAQSLRFRRTLTHLK